MAMVIPTKYGIGPRTRAIVTRVVAAQRAQIALRERVFAIPTTDSTNAGQLHWVDTIDGPVLRGDYLPAVHKAIR